MKELLLSFQRLGITLALVTGFWGASVPATKAVRLADGTVAFSKSPQLLDAITTYRAVKARGARYYFTLLLPETLDEPLQKITVNLRQGADEIEYRLDRTIAAEGMARNKGEAIAIAETNFDPETDTVTVTFAQPIPPGTTFSVGLKPERNPDYGGIYLFGVTAFPAGEKVQGLYLGAARLQFERGSDSHFR